MNVIKILGAAFGAAVAGVTALAIFNPGSVAETSADAKDKALHTRNYKVDLKTFVEEIEKIIPTLSTYGRNWKLASRDVSENSAVIKAEVPVVFFTDDLDIKASYNALTVETTVNARSAARLGSSDLGENRRHILQILEVLDKHFPLQN